MTRNIILIVAVLLAAGVVLFRQRELLSKAREVNARMAAQSVVLQRRAGELQQRRAGLKRQLAETRDRTHELRTSPETVAGEDPPMVLPDPAHQGGWPENAPYFYLPKKDLASVGFRLFEAHRLTDDAATLFGMTDTEREAVNAAYDALWRKYRQLEIERMEPVEKPSAHETNSPLWSYIGPRQREKMQDQYVAYRIPSLVAEVAALRAEFAGSLQQSLGQTRTAYLLAAASSSFANQLDDLGLLDDLGRNARMICFFQIQDRHGEPKLVFARVNEGIDGQTWTLQPPLDPNSEQAYYARLFGVDVPIRDQ